MNKNDPSSNRFPVRFLVGKGWQVLLENGWLNCATDADARTIANQPTLLAQLGTREESFAEELAEHARVLAKYRIGYGSRFFARRAEEARR